MPLGNGNSFGKRTKSVNKIRRIIKVALQVIINLTKFWRLNNETWGNENDKWND